MGKDARPHDGASRSAARSPSCPCHAPVLQQLHPAQPPEPLRRGSSHGSVCRSPRHGLRGGNQPAGDSPVPEVHRAALATGQSDSKVVVLDVELACTGRPNFRCRQRLARDVESLNVSYAAVLPFNLKSWLPMPERLLSKFWRLPRVAAFPKS